MLRLAIKGHNTRSLDVKMLFLQMGHSFHAEQDYIYKDEKLAYIVDPFLRNGHCHDCDFLKSQGFDVLTLEEFETKFPHKLGDKFCGVEIKRMEINLSDGCMHYGLANGGVYIVHYDKGYSPTPDKESSFAPAVLAAPVGIGESQLSISKPCISLSNAQENKIEIDLGENYELKQEDNKVYAVRKKPPYLKTVKDCFDYWKSQGSDVLYSGRLEYTGFIDADSRPCFPYSTKLLALFRLLVCRDAYWKMYGDWKPDYDECQCLHSVDANSEDYKSTWVEGDSRILVFPTSKLRDEFYENFKDLIDKCKEFL